MSHTLEQVRTHRVPKSIRSLKLIVFFFFFFFFFFGWHVGCYCDSVVDDLKQPKQPTSRCVGSKATTLDLWRFQRHLHGEMRKNLRNCDRDIEWYNENVVKVRKNLGGHSCRSFEGRVTGSAEAFSNNFSHLSWGSTIQRSITLWWVCVLIRDVLDSFQWQPSLDFSSCLTCGNIFVEWITRPEFTNLYWLCWCCV